jgi:hypothetical protein
MLGKKPYEAERIARTETMRASNAGSYLQAKQDGATHFVIDNRAEACSECQDEYEGEVFTIDQDDMMPPLHPNCACVPVYFFDNSEASEWADQLSSDKEDVRSDLDEQGHEVKSDGTSQWTNN